MFYNLLFSAKISFILTANCFQQEQPPVLRDGPGLSPRTSQLLGSKGQRLLPSLLDLESVLNFMFCPFSWLPQVQDLFKYHLGITRSIPTKKVGI